MIQNKTKYFLTLVLAMSVVFSGCKTDKKEVTEAGGTRKAFPKNAPQPLNYENLSKLIQDMKEFSQAVKQVNQKEVQEIDSSYQGVYFETIQQPLLLNVYPDPANSKVIHLVVPKNPQTGSDYVLRFDQKLPVINSNEVIIELHTSSPDAPLSCPMQVTDLSVYMKEYRGHKFQIRYKLFKQFSQSGTFDFDALVYPVYRSKGLPFLVFDIGGAQLTDLTANATVDCK